MPKIIKCSGLIFSLVAMVLPVASQIRFRHCTARHQQGSEQNNSQTDYSQSVAVRSVVTIPVVVHVVWNSEDENISDEQVFSQIEVLNKDFRAQNVEVANIPSVFQPLIADVEFEFCLAKTDPDGNASTGITRTFTQNTVGIGGSSSLHYSAQGGKDAWDTERYLNIYVAKFAGGVGGIASFPGQGPAAEQAVEIDYRQFGTINAVPPYHLGRTCTHEIGHYFNLEHPWGPGFDDCCEDDFVADTPEACDTYLGECPTFPISSCSEPDMFMNFMFYTNDECMGMFTLGQKERMLAALNEARPGLLEGEACVSVPVLEANTGAELVIIGNPAIGQMSFEIKGSGGRLWDVQLVDLLGRKYCQNAVPENESMLVSGEGWAPGIYFLLAKHREHRLSQQVVFF